MATRRELLLLDANVVIDYAVADLGVLGRVARHIGRVYVVRSVLEEVEQVRERDCERLGASPRLAAALSTLFVFVGFRLPDQKLERANRRSATEQPAALKSNVDGPLS